MRLGYCLGVALVLCLGVVGRSYFRESSFSEIRPAVVKAAEIRGDADCSGSVDARDAFAILSADVGYRAVSELCAANADVNGDGRITAVDAELVLQYDAGLIGGF